MNLLLEGKRALVTGGSRGIGKAVARQLGLEGVDVVIAARDQDRLDAVAAELTAEHGRAVVPLVVDTGDDDSVRRMGAEAISALGGIDILVNGAARPGGQSPAPGYAGMTSELFFEEMNTKVYGYLRCVQAVAPSMIASRWGRIINISGLAARQVSWIGGSVRNVGVVAMSKNLADELAPHGINVTAVHPGATVTEATSDEAKARPATNLVGRLIDASEVADVITFLCSPRSVGIDGDTVVVGGGVPRVIYY